HVERGVLPLRLEVHREAHWLGDAAQGEPAVGDYLATHVAETGADEVRAGVLRHVEEILAGQRALLILVVHRDAGRGHGHVELRLRELGGVVADRGMPLLEAAVETRALEVAGEAQRAGRLHRVVAGQRGAGQGECQQQAGAESMDLLHGSSHLSLRNLPNSSMRLSTLSPSNTWCFSAAPTCATSTSSRNQNRYSCTACAKPRSSSFFATSAGRLNSLNHCSGLPVTELNHQPLSGSATINTYSAPCTARAAHCCQRGADSSR